MVFMPKQKTAFEELGGTYSLFGDYLLSEGNPEDSLTVQCLKAAYGIWGALYRQHLKEHDRDKYHFLLASGELYDHIAKVNLRAEYLFDDTIRSLAEQQGITKQLKTDNYSEWLTKMQSILYQATESVIVFITQEFSTESASTWCYYNSGKEVF